ncbi:MAG: translation initiation factor IF-5A [Candidatus Aenigmatarchaeota archaeon]
MAEKPVPVKDLNEGNYVMADGEPCRVVSITISKPGKHGSTKARIECMGLFDNKRHYILKPTSATVMVPVIEKKKAQVLSVSENIAQLMDMTDYSVFEVTIPEELKGKITAGQEIDYWRIAGRVMLRP